MSDEILLSRRRKLAVHWLRPTKIEVMVYGEVRTFEVACGTALDEVGWRNCTTKDPKLVTCKDCYAIVWPNDMFKPRSEELF